ncbi:hypothetical protein ZIOFF_005671 [Zingiber officinale]|uniref:Uncharacterized protein n=1 Tax=Zingiber officinale TaxID=94328 RepID=A0A8J5ICW9_ZINOF|nr:hypothetical protein ZIOFF_005671 [Zingiber officinale]
MSRIALMLPIVVRNIKSGVIDNKQVVAVQVILVRATLGVQIHVEEGNVKYEMDTKFVIVIVNNSIALMLPIVVRNIKSGVIDNKQVVAVQVILVRATLGVQIHVEEGNVKYEMDTKFVIVIVNNSIALMLPIVVRNIKSGVIDNKQVVEVLVILVRATLGVQIHVEEGNVKYEMDTKFVIVIVNNSVKMENKLYYPS